MKAISVFDMGLPYANDVGLCESAAAAIRFRVGRSSIGNAMVLWSFLARLFPCHEGLAANSHAVFHVRFFKTLAASTGVIWRTEPSRKP